MGYSIILPILVTLVGGYFLVRLRFFFILHPIRTAKRLALALRERRARRSLSLALAGTLGVGNVFGVAMGIIIGGEGTLLWLLISSVFSSVIKYAEALSATGLGAGGVGMASVIRAAYPHFSNSASRLYSFLCLLLAFVMGSAIQSDSVSSAAQSVLSIPPGITAAVFAALVLVVVLGGAKKIVDATEKIIPLTTLIYIIMCFIAIFVNLSELSSALMRVFNSAFSPLAVSGGVLSSAFLKALSEGYARGVLSNEAGAGTSAMAHSTSGLDPATAGLFGICEVFFDTPLLCTLTGLVVITAIGSPSSYTSAMALVSDAFALTLGVPAAVMLFICVFLFAYSTVICWYYYGKECLCSLIRGKLRWIYTPLFITFIFIGALSDSFFTLALCDIILLFMTVLTLTALLLSSHRILEISVRYGILKSKKSRKSD